MKLVFKKRFLEDIARVNSLDVLDEVEAAIDNVKEADNLNGIHKSQNHDASQECLQDKSTYPSHPGYN